MKKIFQRITSAAVSLLMIFSLASCGQEETKEVKDIASRYPDAHLIVLSDEKVTVDGTDAEVFDYTWHADPSEDHNEVKNSPAEYYTGTEPETEAAAYVAHDIKYYPELDQNLFKKVFYDDDTEWAYYYTAEGYEEYIFGTLPVSKTGFPSDMMHSEEEAYNNPVLHITQPGQYILEGEWNGQVLVDLGDTDDTFTDENAKVTLILNNVNINCTVAPGVLFYSVYECDNTWEDKESYTSDVDLANTGANVIVADESVNTVNGANVYRMLKTKYKDETVSAGVQTQKKLLKTDGGFYSYVSMSINGEEENTGILNINAEFEGLDTELHLAINGGIINIYSQDDGINVNEDGVSVAQINGGTVHILGGLGSEGDGIDSNGFLVINGGTVVASASPMSDSGLDSDNGSYIYGGTVIALGSTMDWAESDGTDNTQPVMNLQFSSYQSADEAIEIKDSLGTTVFSYDPQTDTFLDGHSRQYMGAVISSPELKTGNSYTVYVGGIQQGYSSSGTGRDGGFGGGFAGHDFGQGKDKPDNFNKQMPNVSGGAFSGEAPVMPEGGAGGEMPAEPEGGFRMEGPNTSGAAFGGDVPAMPEGGEEMPKGGFNGDMPNTSGGGFDGNIPDIPEGGFGGQGGQQDSRELTPAFTLEDTVNGFSGVADYTQQTE